PVSSSFLFPSFFSASMPQLLSPSPPARSTASDGPAPMLEDLRALPRAFWVLFAGTFINRFGTFVWPFLTIYLTRRGYSPAFAGTAIACFGFGQITGHTL